jgi:hypothetical protein
MYNLKSYISLLIISVIFSYGCTSFDPRPVPPSEAVTSVTINGTLHMSDQAPYTLMLKSPQVTYYMNLDNLAPINYTHLMNSKVMVQGNIVAISSPSQIVFSPTVIYHSP